MPLEEDRQAIDRIDEQILSLLKERAALAKKIGEERGDNFDPARERQVLDRLQELAASPLTREAVSAIYGEIIAQMRLLAAPIRVAYLGPEGTFNHMAARKKFGAQADLRPVDSIPDMFSEVEKKRADCAVVPVENSTEGVVRPTLDMFVDSPLKICAEVNVEIVHHLLSNSPLKDIKRVYSMGQALGQCRQWLRQNLPNAEQIEVSSTARATQLASSNESAAAIASELASELYDVPILCRAIQDSPLNRTRFMIIGCASPAPSGRDKTSILFAVKHEAGALYNALGAFNEHGVNLTMIESRPTKKTPWEYIFFVDCVGHQQEPSVGAAIEALKQHCLFVRVLGSYPEAD